MLTVYSSPRPYIDDDGEIVSDSEAILAHLTGKYRSTIDACARTISIAHAAALH